MDTDALQPVPSYEHRNDSTCLIDVYKRQRDALAKAHIALIGGASGNVDEIVEQLKKGTLQDDPNGKCNHHHEEGNHDCGNHDCGSHTH